MPGIHRRRLILLVSAPLLGLGCADRDPVHVEWPEGLSEVSFLVRHQGEVVVDRQGPFGLGADGRPEAKVELALEEGEGLALLTLSLASLAPRSNRLRLEPIADLQLDRAFGSCDTALFEGYELVRLDTLEPRLLTLGGSTLPADRAASLLDALALRVPHDASRSCTGGASPELVPFMSDLEIPPSGSFIDGALRDPADPNVGWVYYAARGLAWLDDERLAMVTPLYLYLLRRGETFTSTSSNTFRIAPAAPSLPGVGAWYTSAVAVDPTARGTGVDRVLVSFILDPQAARPSTLGAVWAFSFDEAGLVEARLLGETPVPLNSIAVDSRGRFVAGGDEGRAFFGHVQTGIIETLSLGPGRTEPTIAVRDNRSTFGASFYLLTNSAAIFALKLDENVVVALDALAVPDPLSEPRGFDLLPAGDVSPELWMGTYGHGLQRRDVTGRWEERRLDVGLELAPCGEAERSCGRPMIGDFLTTVAVRPDGRILLGPTSCSAALLLEPDSGCIDAVELEGEPVRATARRSRFYHSAVSPSGRVALIGSDRALVVYE